MSIDKTKGNKYRIQIRTGHYSRLKVLNKKEFLTKRELDEQKRLVEILKREDGKILHRRRTANASHLWQAKEIERAFRLAAEYEKEGKNVPAGLLDFDLCPEKDQFIEETAFVLATLGGMSPEVIERIDFEMFCDQGDVNDDWLAKLNISFSQLKETAINLCSVTPDELNFKNKKYLFIGAPKTITSSLTFLKCLKTFADAQKVDGIIAVGPWIKTIFLNKQTSYVEIPKELKDLAENYKFYAIRSNKDRADRMQPLKALGIKFLRGIERKHFNVTGLNFFQSSTQDQIKRFEFEDSTKDILCCTSYVGARSRASISGEYSLILGSGSSGINTPRARHWASSYDSQLHNASIRDSIGGHVLQFDEDERLYPTTFRFEPEAGGIFYDGNVYLPRSIQEGKLHVILTDLHVLSNSHTGFWAFIDFLRTNKERIKSLTLNGDFFSNHVINHYQDKDIRTQAELKAKGLSFLKEISRNRDYLNRILVELKPNVRKCFKKGNHEKNSIKAFLSKSTNHFLDDMLDLDILLGLTKSGFEIIENEEVFKLADMIVIHGNELKKKEARKLAGAKIVRGHSHLLDVGPDGVSLPGMEDPEKAHYLPTKYVRWAIGFGVSTEYKGVASLPHPMLIRKGKYFDMKKIKNIKVKKVAKAKKLKIEYNINWKEK